MTFGQPVFLYGFVLVPALAALALWAFRSRRAAIESLGDPALIRRLSLGVSHRGRGWRTALWFGALALALMALARPQWGEIEQVVEREGVRIMVVLDISQSMLAQDTKPSRLDRAKLEIIDLMGRLDGDEVGLVLFSGSSFIQLPLTGDYATARRFVEGSRPRIISRPGTVIGKAIDTALLGFDPDRTGEKVILLMTDGEDRETDPVAAARRADEDGVLIYVVGFGSAAGQPIPVYSSRGALTGYKRDANGEMVLSRLDEDTLRRVASATGGQYYNVSRDRSAIAEIVANLTRLEQGDLESTTETRRIERFQLFLFAAVAALIAAELIPEGARRRRRPVRTARRQAG